MAKYFEFKADFPSDAAILVIFTAHNEADRIPFFLNYYRALGADHFLAVDNNSTDETRELLSKESDVSYFFTSGSYVESMSGRLWTTELAQTYGMGKWCLTVDLDELFTYPGCEYAPLKYLCAYLDKYHYEGVYSVFLDMYSDKPLSQATYTAGASFLQVCSYFEPGNYQLKRSGSFPVVQIFGGPRQRTFWQSGNVGLGPSMRKLPLVKWRPHFSYRFSTHSTSPTVLADITGATLHFKFFASFKEMVVREAIRGDRTQMEHYRLYADQVEREDLTLFNSGSVQYSNSAQLIKLGVTALSTRYVNEIDERLRKAKAGASARIFRRQMISATEAVDKQAQLNLHHLAAVWEIARQKFEHGIVSTDARSIVGWFLNPAWPINYIKIEAWRGNKIVSIARTGARAAGVPPQFQMHAFEIRFPFALRLFGPSVFVLELKADGMLAPFATLEINNASNLIGLLQAAAKRMRGLFGKGKLLLRRR